MVLLDLGVRIARGVGSRPNRPAGGGQLIAEEFEQALDRARRDGVEQRSPVVEHDIGRAGRRRDVVPEPGRGEPHAAAGRIGAVRGGNGGEALLALLEIQAASSRRSSGATKATQPLLARSLLTADFVVRDASGTM